MRHIRFVRGNIDVTLTYAAASGQPPLLLQDPGKRPIQLAQIDARKSRLVELRFFGGLSLEETAEVLGVSPETAKRDWKMARAWLYTQLAGERKPKKS